MSRFIKTNFDLCTGCSICQLACTMHNNGGYNPRRARLRIIHTKENLYHKPVVCNQCKNAYCLNACPAKAIERDKTGVVLIDEKKCIKCGTCVDYCPENLVHLDFDTGKAVKCDLCLSIPKVTPKCVEACPTGALILVDPSISKANKNE